MDLLAPARNRDDSVLANCEDSSNVYRGVADNLLAQLPSIQQTVKAGIEKNAQILLAKIGGEFVPRRNALLRRALLL